MSKTISYALAPNGFIWPVATSELGNAIDAGWTESTIKRYQRQQRHLRKLMNLTKIFKMPVSEFMKKLEDKDWLAARGMRVFREGKEPPTMYLEVIKGGNRKFVLNGKELKEFDEKLKQDLKPINKELKALRADLKEREAAGKGFKRVEAKIDKLNKQIETMKAKRPLPIHPNNVQRYRLSSK